MGTLKTATVQNGFVVVEGNQAPKFAQKFWEGVNLLIMTGSSGGFKFNTTDLPKDCVGRLKIGTQEPDVVIGNCTPAAMTAIEAGVPKTGQTDFISIGDDGDLEKGVASPNPRFTDNGDGTITDNLTALIWLKNANCPGCGRTWTDALNDVGNLNSDGTMNSNLCGDISNAGSHQID